MYKRQVKGDLHDIGKNLVKMMMEGKGLEVVGLGLSLIHIWSSTLMGQCTRPARTLVRPLSR